MAGRQRSLEEILSTMIDVSEGLPLEEAAAFVGSLAGLILELQMTLTKEQMSRMVGIGAYLVASYRHYHPESEEFRFAGFDEPAGNA